MPDRRPPAGAGEYAGLPVAVAGLGRAGRAAATALLRLGADVVVVDEHRDPRHDAAETALRSAGARVTRGGSEIPADRRLVIASPGLRDRHPMLLAAEARGAEVIGEPELAWRLRPAGAAPWLGITGTNGKTTTVGMLESILRAAGHRAVAAGNVGLPLVEAVLAEPAYAVLAVEISSAQLAQSAGIRFAVGAVLNLAPDHLDWHGDFAAYRAAKLRIWRDAVAVGNADDPIVAAALPADGVGFTLAATPGRYHVEAGALVDRRGRRLSQPDELQLAGPHNVANALAAAAVAVEWGIGADAVRAGLGSFTVGPHRATVVAEWDGIRWIDDSKATNPHAASASLAAHDSVVWIAGGLLKGADVEPLVADHAGRLRGVVLLGRDREAIAAALARHAPQIPVVEVEATDTGAMSAVVAAAARLARAGDVVLLAPAAASWDMFTDYAQRGDLFATAARAARP